MIVGMLQKLQECKVTKFVSLQKHTHSNGHENNNLIASPLSIWSIKLAHFTIKLFLLILIYFHHTSLHGLVCCTLNYSYVLLVSFVSQSLLNRFQYNLYYCLPLFMLYKYSNIQTNLIA